MMRFAIFAVVLVLATSFSDATNVRKCSGAQPFPMSVQVEGCDKLPCTVIKGNTTVMYVHFVGAKSVTNQLTANVRASISSFLPWVPYTLPADVASVCDNLIDGAQCPIYASEDVVYKFNFYIADWYPQISVEVELSLVDENGAAAACFLADIVVQKSVS